MSRSVLLALPLVLMTAAPATCGGKSRAAREAAEYLFGKFGKEAAEQGMETLTQKIEVLAVKHGDDAITAVKKVGPRSFRIVEEAGDNAGSAVKLLARKGSDAVWVVEKKNRLAIFVKFGDDAADAMIKHGEIAEPLITAFGRPAAGALKSVSKQNARRLAMMSDEGSLAKIGRTDELLAVVESRGDRAMDFIWRNKGGLAVTTTLGRFLLNPQPFIDGTVKLADVATGPIKDVPIEVAKRTNWTMLLSICALFVLILAVFKAWLRHRTRAESAAGP